MVKVAVRPHHTCRMEELFLDNVKVFLRPNSTEVGINFINEEKADFLSKKYVPWSINANHHRSNEIRVKSVIHLCVPVLQYSYKQKFFEVMQKYALKNFLYINIQHIQYTENMRHTHTIMKKIATGFNDINIATFSMLKSGIFTRLLPAKMAQFKILSKSFFISHRAQILLVTQVSA